MRKQLLIGLCGLWFVGLPAVLFAENTEPIKFEGVDLVKEVNCKGRPVNVEGTSNKVTIKGDCPRLYISGVENKVWVEAVGVIKVEGMDNNIIWVYALDGEEPEIDNPGSSTVTREELPPEQRKHHRHHGRHGAPVEVVVDDRPMSGPGAGVEVTDGNTSVMVSQEHGGATVAVASGDNAVAVSKTKHGAAVEVASGDKSIAVSKTKHGGAVAVSDGSNQVEVSNRGVHVDSAYGNVDVNIPQKPGKKSPKVKVNAGAVAVE